MSAQPTDFNRGAIKPIECFSAGWAMIKNDYWLMVGVCFVGIMIGSVVPMGIILGPMMCGIHLCLLAIMRRERVEFALLFKGFDYFVPSLIATLIQVVPMLVILVPAYIIFIGAFIAAGAAAGNSRNGEPPPEVALALFGGMALFVLVVLVVSAVVGLLFLFVYQLIVDRKLSGWDACKTSARAVMGNIGGALGLLVINMLLGIVGVMLCYVGAILVLPISFAAFDVAYRRVFPEMAMNAPPHYAPPPAPDYGQYYPPGQ